MEILIKKKKIKKMHDCREKFWLCCKTLPSIGFWLNVQISYYANVHIVELSDWCGNLKFHMKISYVKRLQFHMCKFNMWEIHMWKFHMWNGSSFICVSVMWKFHMWKGSNSVCVNFMCKFHMWKGSNSICGISYVKNLHMKFS